jgi:hypothetical protein
MNWDSLDEGILKNCRDLGKLLGIQISKIEQKNAQKIQKRKCKSEQK